ncbi:hypothetical protein ABW19_dt0208619 [Dactylella cylindrospora]|nr:hypothetical protein ABW19_dt0208619 [Dactylella cylindrospora]
MVLFMRTEMGMVDGEAQPYNGIVPRGSVDYTYLFVAWGTAIALLASTSVRHAFAITTAKVVGCDYPSALAWVDHFRKDLYAPNEGPGMDPYVVISQDNLKRNSLGTYQQWSFQIGINKHYLRSQAGTQDPEEKARLRCLAALTLLRQLIYVLFDFIYRNAPLDFRQSMLTKYNNVFQNLGKLVELELYGGILVWECPPPGGFLGDLYIRDANMDTSLASKELVQLIGTYGTQPDREQGK